MTLPSHGRYDYQPITRRPDFTWPNGARLAVYVALGVEDYRFSDGLTENLLAGASKPDFVNTSWRDYGNRVGGFRLIDRLASFGIAPAILLNTAVYDTAPDLIETARAAGAEMVGHGITNSDTLAGMGEAEERAYLDAVATRIAREEGEPPRGWSSPWLAQTERTFDLLGEAGYGYVLDLRLDDQPVWLNTRAKPLLALPYALELNDSSTIIGRQAGAAEFAEMIINEFDELLDASARQPLVMSVVVHSFISGAPFRLKTLTRALEHIAARRDDVWLTTPRRIADAYGGRVP
ncbi:polysaccharide deacetylase family protein [Lichenihabitans sp. Uapishka_5]|uniref:polysaccharide deacetylase family protein n=1 Tax=Lichenihabitans sp. Uapishka_5 TaxID=3037302 RepID=UPI0029E7FEC9|nr:polysaccharide deacetylase family protein [Lichenihabitans sp. Uapishka_5]MDX7950781.1 polysaccharide deacetylase family protein [Lichenihabitans sp. Uapishka_5]